MTPSDVIDELLRRLISRKGARVYIGTEELASWPTDNVAALKAAQMLVEAQPVLRAICPGCERHCLKPVQVLPAEGDRAARLLIVCNEPEDLGLFHIEPRVLERWQIDGDQLAFALGRILDLSSPQRDETGKRWTLGLLHGNRRNAEVTLVIDQSATLLVAGHTVSIAKIMTVEGDMLSIDAAAVRELVDNPVVSGSPEERRDRITKRIEQLKARGIRNFLVQVAKEEVLTVSRIKQLRWPSAPKLRASSKGKKP